MKYLGRCEFCQQEISEIMYEQFGGVCRICDSYLFENGKYFRNRECENCQYYDNDRNICKNDSLFCLGLDDFLNLNLIDKYVDFCNNVINYMVSNKIDFTKIGNDLKHSADYVSKALTETINMPFLYKLALHYGLKENWLK